MYLVNIRESEESFQKNKWSEHDTNKWTRAALFQLQCDAMIYREGIEKAYENMETVAEFVDGDLHLIADPKTDKTSREAMEDNIKEDLNRLTTREIGKVIKYIRRELISKVNVNVGN